MQKYVFVKFLEKMNQGTEFSAGFWPLHTTIVSNFAIDWESAGLLEKLTALLAERKPIAVAAQNDEYFGNQKQIQVTILEPKEELMVLHKDIITILKSCHAVFDEPEYLEEGYRAHVTVQRDKRIHKNDIITIDELSIVDMYPQNDINRRKLLGTIKLCG